MKTSYLKRGFTLIELLIVITIIGILAVALIPRITGGTARARDAQRKADLQQIATALQFYSDDNGGKYPTGTEPCASTVAETFLSSYLVTIPSDPSSNGLTGGSTFCSAGYTYYPLNTDSLTATKEGYLLIAKLETTTETANSGIYLAGTGLSSLSPSLSASDNFEDLTACTGGATTPCAENARVYILGR
ncbi:MAG: prepilin-type N-terminal cleavage/methylation domain-containing protein [Candidatus Gracilibacteria bacterium]|jgi:general secretion pathway protein G